MKQKAIRLLLAAAIATTPFLSAQSPKDHPQEGAQSPAKGGSADAGVFPPVLDAQKRPITAGGTVKTGPIVFQDIAQKAGLTTWHHTMGSPDKKYILESIGSGVALLDYDNDGWLDIYLVNGSTEARTRRQSHFPSRRPLPQQPRRHLHRRHRQSRRRQRPLGLRRSRRRLRQRRLARHLRLQLRQEPPLPQQPRRHLHRRRRKGRRPARQLVHRRHLGRLRRRRQARPLRPRLRPLRPQKSAIRHRRPATRLLQLPRRPHHIAVRAVSPAKQDHLFHNNGNGTFTDVSEKPASTISPATTASPPSSSMSTTTAGVDLLVANDSTPNYLYINKGDGTFEDESYPSGYALNKNGAETASMGIALGDYRNNGQLDIFNTTFSDDYKVLYRNDGDANFTDVSDDLHIASMTIPFLGWGTQFLDYDNDGWKDLLEVNGHIYRNADANNWGTSWAQRPLLFHNQLGKKLEPVPAVEGTALAETMTSRGLAIGDLFNDGRLGCRRQQPRRHPRSLRQRRPQQQPLGRVQTHAAAAHPAPTASSPPAMPSDATLYLTAGGIRQRADISSGGSFASTSDPRPHFGLGQSTTVDVLEVHWPSGRVETFPVSRHSTASSPSKRAIREPAGKPGHQSLNQKVDDNRVGNPLEPTLTSGFFALHPRAVSPCLKVQPAHHDCSPAIRRSSRDSLPFLALQPSRLTPPRPRQRVKADGGDTHADGPRRLQQEDRQRPTTTASAHESPVPTLQRHHGHRRVHRPQGLPHRRLLRPLPPGVARPVASVRPLQLQPRPLLPPQRQPARRRERHRLHPPLRRLPRPHRRRLRRTHGEVPPHPPLRPGRRHLHGLPLHPEGRHSRHRQLRHGRPPPSSWTRTASPSTAPSPTQRFWLI